MTDRQNIVIVLCDQMRRQAMGCAGDPNVSTPHLDQLAADGVRFTNANSTCPICVPARFSFVTGEHAHTRFAHNGWRMSPGERTFADELSAAGYRTAYIGKWHLAKLPGWRAIPQHLRGGFDYWRGFEVRNDPFDSYYFADDDPARREIDGYQTDGLFSAAVEFLEDHETDDRPFCLVVSVEPPHPPFTAPREYLDRYADRRLELRPNVPYGDGPPPRKHVPPDGVDEYEAWGDLNHATEDLYEAHNYHGDVMLDEMRAYYAMIENLDDNVGRLVDTLERRGLRDDTAVMFTSDHGDMMGSHGLTAKQHPYEESVGVPLILSHPGGGIDDGRTIDAPTCTEDWYPTILGFAGIDAPDKPGVDLGPLARGDRSTPDRSGVLLEFVREIRSGMPYHDEQWRGFRTERYKYVVKGPHAEGAEPWQLFDLAEDPYEEHNLIDDPDHAGVARDLHGALRDALRRYSDDFALDPAFGYEGLNLPTQ